MHSPPNSSHHLRIGRLVRLHSLSAPHVVPQTPGQEPESESQEWPMLYSPSPPRHLSDPPSAASDPASLWPPAFSQERARRTLFEMITCKGKNGDYHISIEDVPAFVELIRTLVHPSVRSHVAGFTVARVEANVRYLNE